MKAETLLYFSTQARAMKCREVLNLRREGVLAFQLWQESQSSLITFFIFEIANPVASPSELGLKNYFKHRYLNQIKECS